MTQHYPNHDYANFFIVYVSFVRRYVDPAKFDIIQKHHQNHVLII
jgi:hypothetical protein